MALIPTEDVDRLAQEPRAEAPNLAGKLLAIGRHCAALPLLDGRSVEKILGYGVSGISC